MQSSNVMTSLGIYPIPIWLLVTLTQLQACMWWGTYVQLTCDIKASGRYLFRMSYVHLIQILWYLKNWDQMAKGWTGKCMKSMCVYFQKCAKCKNEYKWDSQPYVRRMAVGNLLVSAAILFSGCVISKAMRMFSYINVSSFILHQIVLCALRCQNISQNLHIYNTNLVHWLFLKGSNQFTNEFI